MVKPTAALFLFFIFASPAISHGQAGTENTATRKEYYPDGKFKATCDYNNRGLLDGTCKTYDREGVLYLVETYKDNRLTSYKALYPNGSLQRLRTYRNGKMHGPSKEFYESGKLKSVTNYKDDKSSGPSKGFYESGMLRFELTHKNGKAEGIMKQYYENGSLRFETFYTKGTAVGAWKEYDKKGRLIK